MIVLSVVIHPSAALADRPPDGRGSDAPRAEQRGAESGKRKGHQGSDHKGKKEHPSRGGDDDAEWTVQQGSHDEGGRKAGKSGKAPHPKKAPHDAGKGEPRKGGDRGQSGDPGPRVGSAPEPPAPQPPASEPPSRPPAPEPEPAPVPAPEVLAPAPVDQIEPARVQPLSSSRAGTAARLGTETPGTMPPEPAPVPDEPAEVAAPISPRPVRTFGTAPPWVPFAPALDEPAFPALLLGALALFLVAFGRGDRRDPKLVEAVVDDRSQDVDFS